MSNATRSGRPDRVAWNRGWNFAVAGAVALSSCSGLPTDTGNATAFFPLRVSSAWSYHSFDATTGDPALFAPVKPDSDFAVRVLRDTVDASGMRWYAMENARRIFSGATTVYFGNDSSGLLTLTVLPGLSGQQFGVSSPLIFYPVVLGQRAQFGVVTALDTTITVPAGTFKCVRYDDVDSFTSRSLPFFTVFLAPQVGVVKRIRFNDTYVDNSGRVTAQRSRVDWLVAYQP
jgi:hypothetical protein